MCHTKCQNTFRHRIMKMKMEKNIDLFFTLTHMKHNFNCYKNKTNDVFDKFGKREIQTKYSRNLLCFYTFSTFRLGIFLQRVLF